MEEDSTDKEGIESLDSTDRSSEATISPEPADSYNRGEHLKALKQIEESNRISHPNNVSAYGAIHDKQEENHESTTPFTGNPEQHGFTESVKEETEVRPSIKLEQTNGQVVDVQAEGHIVLNSEVFPNGHSTNTLEKQKKEKKPVVKSKPKPKPKPKKKRKISGKLSSSDMTSKSTYISDPESPILRTHNSDGEELYCICRGPDNGKWMIGCDFCDDWFHGSCVAMRESDSELIVKYACPNCVKKGLGVSLWKRICRLPSCRNPVSHLPGTNNDSKASSRPSKYCCAEHGIEFFTVMVRDSNRLTLSVPQLSEAVKETKSVDEFINLGNTYPTIPQDKIMSRLSAEDLDQIAEIELKKQEIKVSRSYSTKKRIYLKLARDRAERVKRDIAREANSKKKPICGFDEILSLREQDWRLFVDSEAGKELFASYEKDPHFMIPGRQGVCLVDPSKCKHKFWKDDRDEEGVISKEITLQERLNDIEMERLTERLERIYDKARLPLLTAHSGVVEAV